MVTTIGAVAGSTIVAIFWILLLVWRRQHSIDRLDGWWHQQSFSGGTRRWMPEAWKVACTTSLERSRRRRRG